MGCLKSTILFLLIVFNTMAAFFGLFTAIICAMSLGTLHNWHYAYGIIGIVAGALAFSISICGCCTFSRQESRCFMATYIIMLTIVLCTQIGIMLSFNMRYMVKTTTDMVEQLWAEESMQPGPMASMEQTYKCCGLNSSDDYFAANFTVPGSCYENGYASETNKIFPMGCFEKMSLVSNKIAKFIKIIFWIFTGVEGTSLILAAIFSCCFMNTRQTDYTPF